MNNVFLRIIFCCFIIINGLDLVASIKIDTSRTNKRIRHRTWAGIAKSNYFTSRAPSVYGEVQTIIDNVVPVYSIGYEGIAKITQRLYLGLGTSFTNSKFMCTYTNFVSSNIKTGLVNFQVVHNYLSIPINVYWRIPVSSMSSVYLFTGVESFRTIKFEQTHKEFVSIYKNDASSDNNYKVVTQFKSEPFSLFRTFNSGLRFELNEKSHNRVSIGFNYYLMRNSFPLEIKSNMFVGNKNFETTNHIYFEGLRFSIGYLW